MKKEKRIVLGVTGSIAAYKSADIIRRLREKGFRVSVVMSKQAEKFITPLTLSSLAGEEVVKEMFEAGSADWQMPHINLAKQADVFLIAPATANIIGKMANGIADDLMTCVFLATKAKVAIAPAMNTAMYKNKIVQENCKKLISNGVHLIEPVKGNLACGDEGQGHIAAVEDIVKEVIRLTK